VLACKLRLIRQAPIAPPAAFSITDVRVTPTPDSGFQLTGGLLATNNAGQTFRATWTCATELRPTGWYPWSVAISPA
jgi:hypothetical protein